MKALFVERGVLCRLKVALCSFSPFCAHEDSLLEHLPNTTETASFISQFQTTQSRYAGAFGQVASSKVASAYRQAVQAMGSSKHTRHNPRSTFVEDNSSRVRSQVRRLGTLAQMDPSAAAIVVRKCPQIGSIEDREMASRMVLLKQAFPGLLHSHCSCLFVCLPNCLLHGSHLMILLRYWQQQEEVCLNFT
jgi:hypothetical protein